MLQFLWRSGGTPQLLLAISSLSSRRAESVCVCASAGVCLCVGAGLQRFHSGVRRAKFVCVVPLGETIANSRKWIGMEGLARDSGVKMKEFFHTQRNSLSLFLPLSFCFRMHSLSPPLGLQ